MGKSTLLSLLEGHNFDKHYNSSTNGLVISSIYLPRSLYNPIGIRPSKNSPRISSLFNAETKEDTVQFNVVDFGGQDIFQSTHRFFLTPKSIYIVMCNLSDAATFNRVEYQDS